MHSLFGYQMLETSDVLVVKLKLSIKLQRNLKTRSHLVNIENVISWQLALTHGAHHDVTEC